MGRREVSPALDQEVILDAKLYVNKLVYVCFIVMATDCRCLHALIQSFLPLYSMLCIFFINCHQFSSSH